MNTILRSIAAAGLTACAFALSGCAAPANQQAMTVSTPVKIAKQYPFSVSVSTSGGAATGALDSSAISNDDLKAAIETSIRDSKLFNDILQGQPGQYQLAVVITQIDKPLFGASFTVNLETAWSLVRSSDKQVVWRKAIKGAHTATMSDAFIGVKRLQLAVEGAARANIEQGIVGISEAMLDGNRQAKAAN